MIIYEKEYLQQLHYSLGQAVFAVKFPERTIEYVNPAIERVFGYSLQECVGKTTEIIYPTHQDYLNFGKLIAETIRQNKKILNTEYELKRKNGEFFKGEITSSFIKKNNKIISVVSIIQDITDRKQIEQELVNEKKNLEEVNAALRIILREHELRKTEIEEKVFLNIEKLLLPYLSELASSNLNEKQLFFLDVIQKNIQEITSSFAKDLTQKYNDLTPREIQIANLIRQGRTNKEIAKLLAISPSAVDFHRQGLRKKLNIRGKKKNLRTTLLDSQF